MQPKQSSDSSPLSFIDEPVLSSPQISSRHEATNDDDAPTPSLPSPMKTRRVLTSQPKKKAVAKRPAKKSKWDTESLMTDPKSPLAKADLRSVLSTPMAWDILDAEDKAEILALLPDNAHVLDADTENARPDVMALRNDDTFRHDCASFTEHISLGRFEPDWLASAWAAQDRRKIGDFDEFLVKKFESDWGVELPDDFKPRRENVAVEQGVKGSESGDRMSIDTAMTGDRIDTTSQVNEDADQGPSKEKQEPQPTVEEHLGNGGIANNDDEMAIDELQVEAQEDKPAAPPSVKKRMPTIRKSKGGSESEDELA